MQEEMYRFLVHYQICGEAAKFWLWKSTYTLSEHWPPRTIVSQMDGRATRTTGSIGAKKNGPLSFGSGKGKSKYKPINAGFGQWNVEKALLTQSDPSQATTPRSIISVDRNQTWAPSARSPEVGLPRHSLSGRACLSVGQLVCWSSSSLPIGGQALTYSCI